MENINFKEAIINFLKNNWDDDFMINIIKNKKVFITDEDKCYSFYVKDDKIVRTEEKL